MEKISVLLKKISTITLLVVTITSSNSLFASDRPSFGKWVMDPRTLVLGGIVAAGGINYCINSKRSSFQNNSGSGNFFNRFFSTVKDRFTLSGKRSSGKFGMNLDSAGLNVGSTGAGEDDAVSVGSNESGLGKDPSFSRRSSTGSDTSGQEADAAHYCSDGNFNSSNGSDPFEEAFKAFQKCFENASLEYQAAIKIFAREWYYRGVSDAKSVLIPIFEAQIIAVHKQGLLQGYRDGHLEGLSNSGSTTRIQEFSDMPT